MRTLPCEDTGNEEEWSLKVPVPSRPAAHGTRRAGLGSGGRVIRPAVPSPSSGWLTLSGKFCTHPKHRLRADGSRWKGRGVQAGWGWAPGLTAASRSPGRGDQWVDPFTTERQ